MFNIIKVVRLYFKEKNKENKKMKPWSFGHWYFKAKKRPIRFKQSIKVKAALPIINYGFTQNFYPDEGGWWGWAPGLIFCLLERENRVVACMCAVVPVLLSAKCLAGCGAVCFWCRSPQPSIALRLYPNWRATSSFDCRPSYPHG